MELDDLTVRIRVMADEADTALSAFAERVRRAGAQTTAAQEAAAAFAGGLVGLAAQSARAASALNSGGEAVARQDAQMRAGAASAAELQAAVAQVEGEAKRLSAGLQATQGYEAAGRQADALSAKLYQLEGAAQSRLTVNLNTEEAHSAVSALVAQTSKAARGMDDLRRASDQRAGGLTGSLKLELIELNHLIAIGLADTADEVAALADMAVRYANAGAIERYALEDRLAKARERLRQENLRADLDAISHEKALGELSLEQELGRLARVRAAHRMTAAEINELEERMYDVRQSIRQRDASAIDGVADGLTDALTARYQRWQTRELAALDQSRDQWQRWADDSTDALQRQIDALDALATAEDRAAEDEKDLRQLESLRQQIAYEQDDYNRAMLQASLEQAVEARAERLRERDAADARAALQAQKEAVAERLQAEKDALDAQREAVRSAYDERTQSQSLAAEAERLLLAQNQDELIALLTGYAPAYNALGQTLGEKLADGFAASLTDVTAWFDALARQVSDVQEQMNDAALAAADTFYAANRAALSAAQAVTIEQSNTFNVPVESPSDTARKVAQANEDLGLTLLGL